MKINVEKNILLDGEFSYILKDIEGMNNAFLRMLSKGIYVIAPITDDRVDASSLLNKDELGVFLVSTSIVDNGDYDYEDEWVPNYQEEDTYHQILYCPCSGEKFEFNIIKENDLRKEQQDLLDKIDVVSKYRSKVKRQECNELYNELSKLVQNNLYY